MTPAGEPRLEIVGDGPLASAIRAQAAGSAVPPDLARVVVIDHGDDGETLAALRRLRGAGARVFATIRDGALRRAVQSRLDADDAPPTLFGPADLEAETFAARFRPDRMAWMRAQPGVHLAIVGFGARGQALFDALAASGVAVGLARPRILIVAADAAQARARIDETAPEIGLSLDLDVVEGPPRSLADPDRSPLAAAERAAPLTAILLAEETAEATLAACLAICELQDRHGLAKAALFIGGPSRDIACDLVAPLRPPRRLDSSVEPIGGLDEVNLYDYLLNGRDGAARRLHEAYRQAYGDPTTPPWERLGETFRRANRRAAAHIAQKLAALGFDACDDARVDPAAYAAVLRPLLDAPFEDAPIRALARLEHERWSLDRRLDGWRYDAVRDDKRRRHPSLVAFDDPRLSAAEVGKDIAQVRFVLDAMVESTAGGARRRLAIAVAAPAAPGDLDLAQALDLIDKQPWRAPTLMSPLSTPGEIAAVEAMIAACAKRALRYRLIVQTRADAAEPALDPLDSARRAALLDDVNAFLAPLAGAPQAAANWIDAGDASPGDLAALVRSRCDIGLRAD